MSLVQTFWEGSPEAGTRRPGRCAGGSYLMDMEPRRSGVRAGLEPRIQAGAGRLPGGGRKHDDEVAGPARGDGLRGLRVGFDEVGSALSLQRSVGNQATTNAIRRLAHRSGTSLRRAPTPAARSVPRAPVIQRKHLSIPEAVNTFKTQIKPSNETAGTSLATSGQFYWTGLIGDRLRAKHTALLAHTVEANKGPWNPQVKDPFGLVAVGEGPTARPMSGFTEFEVVPGKGPWSYLMNVLGEAIKTRLLVDAAPLAKAIEVVKNLKREGHLWPGTIARLPEVEAMLASPSRIPGATPMAKGKGLYYKFWGVLNGKAGVIPDLSPYVSIPIRGCLDIWENQACGFTGSLAAALFVANGGMKTANPDAKRQASTKSSALLATSATRDMRKVGDRRRGDVLRQGGAAGAAAGMRRALDDGWILHARVLSGIDYGDGQSARDYDIADAAGKTPRQPVALGKPPEEHSIMIIGYDGNQFVFWDPDSGSSNQHGAGFGALFVSGAGLTTASSEGDLLVDNNGNHVPGRHRYQVISFGSQ